MSREISQYRRGIQQLLLILISQLLFFLIKKVAAFYSQINIIPLIYNWIAVQLINNSARGFGFKEREKSTCTKRKVHMYSVHFESV